MSSAQPRHYAEPAAERSRFSRLGPYRCQYPSHGSADHVIVRDRLGHDRGFLGVEQVHPFCRRNRGSLGRQMTGFHQIRHEGHRIQNSFVVPLELAFIVQYVRHAVAARQHFHEVQRSAVRYQRILRIAIRKLGQLLGTALNSVQVQPFS